MKLGKSGKIHIIPNKMWFSLGCTVILSSLAAQSKIGPLTWGGRDERLALVNPIVLTEEERQNTISLSGEWEFSAKQMHRAPFRTGMWEHYYKMKWEDARTIKVPGCWEAQGVGEAGESEGWPSIWDKGTKLIRHKHMGDGWYRRNIEIPSEWTGKRIWLKIGGVKACGWFWVNETPVAQVANYCGTYKYEITDLVTPGSNAVVVAQVNNAVPSRKGLMSFVNRWGGLYRDVEIEATPESFIDDTYIRGLFDEKTAEIHATVDPAKADISKLKLRVTIDGKTVCKPIERSDEHVVKLPLNPFRAWSPEHPNLYTARVDLVEGEKIVHSKLERFGVRKYEVRGKEFYLNGKPFYVRGFGDDFIYPITGMTPPDRDFHRANLAKAKAAGFNYVRLHTHCEVPEYFEVADELGIMVQPELPYYSDFPCDGCEWDPVRDVIELWRNYRRYPSFVTYSGGNEGSIGGKAFDARFHKFVKAMDPDRLKINEDAEAPWVNPAESADYVGGPKNLWKRGSFNPERPFVNHEYLNCCIKVDSRDEDLFTGEWFAPVTRKARAEWLAKRGLGMQWGDRLQDAQHALQRHYQKNGVEWARKDPYCDGYHFWTIVDVATSQKETCTSIGLFNALWKQKRGGFSAEEFAKFNSPSCILLDTPEERYIYESGESADMDFLFAHYGEKDISKAKLKWNLAANGRILLSNERTINEIAIGPVRKIATEKITFPAVKKPVKIVLSASLGDVENSWDLWLFPKREKRDARHLAVAPALKEAMEKLYKNFAVIGSSKYSEDCIVVAQRGSKEEEMALKEGRKVVSIGKTEGVPNIKLGTWFISNQVGTALLDHPIFGDLPHEGVLSPLLFRIIGKGAPLKDSRWDEKDLFMVGEGGEDCYMYLARRKVGKGVAYESFGLDLLSGTPEGTAILDGIIEYLLQDSSNHAPKFFAPNDFGVADKIKDLSSVVGPNWREVAEKNRTLNLHKLHGEDLTFAIRDITLKYKGTNSLDTSKVPLEELGEIVEASFRGGINTESYAWALLRNFLTSDKKVSDPTTAAKILSCIDKNLAGVAPKDKKGEVVSFSPYWRITSFRSGSYKTVLPCDGFFESKWSYSLGECSYDLRTSAKRIDCHIGIALFMKVYNVTVNGEDVDFNSTKFTAIPNKDGIAKIRIFYSWTGKKKQKAKQ